MTAGNVSRIIRAPGRVVVNPATSFATTAYPYGGTEVGKTNLCVLQPLGTSFRVEYESLGEAGDILESSNAYLFACFVRGWDDDAVELLFPGNHEGGTVTRHAVYQAPGDRTPGASTLDRSISLVYVPDDPIRVPGVLIYNGITDWSEAAELAFQRGTDLGIPVAVDCLRDENNNILRVGRLQDLTLT